MRTIAWRSVRRALLPIAVLALLAPAVASADLVYWTDSSAGGGVRVGNLNGSGSAANVYTGGAFTLGLALNAGAGTGFWTDPSTGRISSGALDGSGDFTVPGDYDSPYGIAIDPSAERLYWAEEGVGASAGAIRTAQLDGTESADLFSGESYPKGVAIDPAANKIYWAADGNPDSPGTQGSVRVGNLDGTGTASDLFPVGPLPTGVAIDAAAAKIYWSRSAGGGAIVVGNLGGSGTPAPLFEGEFFPGGIALDPAANKIYWAADGLGAPGGGAIRVGSLDGTGIATDLFASENRPRFLSLLREPVAAELPEVSGEGETGKPLSCGLGAWESDLLGAFLSREPASFSRQWLRNAVPVAGAAGERLIPTEPGSYQCRVTAANHAGSKEQTSAAITVVRGRPPNTRITGRPKRTVATANTRATVRFRFRSSKSGSSFECKLRDTRWKACASPRTYRAGKGRHKFQVRATDRLGNTDPSPATWRFRVKAR